MKLGYVGSKLYHHNKCCDYEYCFGEDEERTDDEKVPINNFDSKLFNIVNVVVLLLIIYEVSIECVHIKSIS